MPSGELAAATWGPDDGPVVLCLPGITGSKEDFSLVGPLLAAAGYRVVAVDLAGQYESAAAGPAPGGRYDLDLHVRDALALLDRFGPAHVIGYSFAGLVAAGAAVERPDLVRTLTFMSVPPLPGDALGAVKVVGPLARVAGPRVAAALMTWGVSWNLNRAPATRRVFVRDRLRWTRHESVIDAMDAMQHVPDVAARLRATGAPLLVVAGQGDLWSTARHRRFAERVGAAYREYPTGHSPLETMPGEVADDVLALLATATGTDAPDASDRA